MQCADDFNEHVDQEPIFEAEKVQPISYPKLAKDMPDPMMKGKVIHKLMQEFGAKSSQDFTEYIALYDQCMGNEEEMRRILEVRQAT